MNILVYGTLKKGHYNSYLLKGQTFLDDAKTVAAYKLYSLGSFPGLVHCKAGVQVEGEIWQVNEECLKNLDRLEGHPNFYKREKVSLSSHPNLDVEVYIYQGDCKGKKDIGTKWER